MYFCRVICYLNLFPAHELAFFKKIFEQNELRFNISSLSPSMYVLKNSLETWQIFMKNAFRLSVKIVYLIAKFLSHSPHCVVGY